MKATVKFEYNEQKRRQTAILEILLSMLGFSQLRIAVYLIFGIAFIIAGSGLILVGALVLQQNGSPNIIVIISGVVTLLGGVIATTGVITDVVLKKRKRKTMLAKLHKALDDTFVRLKGLTHMTIETGEQSVKLTYLAGDREITSDILNYSSVCVIIYKNQMMVDFSVETSFCFMENDLGAEKTEELRQILMAKHESYRVLEKDEKGRFVLLGDNTERK